MAHEWQWARQNHNISTSQALYPENPQDTLREGHADSSAFNKRDGQEWEGISNNGYTEQYPESEDPSEESVPEVEQAVHDHDTPTPPINVPVSSNDSVGGRRLNSGMRPPTYYDSGSLEKYMRSRRTSISFDPKIKTDDGDRATLVEGPPPKLSIKTRPRGKSLLDEIAAKRDRPTHKAHSENDRQEYDPVSGERLDILKEGARDGRYTAHQPRWPLLQSTVDALATGSSPKTVDQSTSLTSRTTLSPSAESQPPSEPLLTPLTSYSPSRADRFSSGSQDSPRRFNSRSKSYSSDRRSLSRRVSQRGSANSASPASAFLKKYTVPSPATPPSPDSEGQEIRDYVLGRQIGFGGFSVIREAFTLSGKERIRRAVKIVRHQGTGKEEAENESLQLAFEHEIDLWRRLSHAHILPLIDIYFTPYATFAFMKLTTGGTLFDLVRSNRSGLLPRLTRRYVGQLASALRHLHEDLRIVHRDLKLENCLLDMSTPDAAETGGSLLLCDFGLADYLTSSEDSSSNSPLHSAQEHYQHPGTGHDPRTPASPQGLPIGPSETSTSLAGSLPYAAPELLDAGQGYLSTKADIWAFGVVCFALVMGKLPFTHAFSPMVSAMILKGEWDKEGLRLKDVEEGKVENATAGKVDEISLNRVTTANDGHAINTLNETKSDDLSNHTIATNVPSLDSTNSSLNENLPLTPPSEPELFLSGVAEFVESCLVQQPHLRWDISACLASRWLEIENEAYDDVKVWSSGGS